MESVKKFLDPEKVLYNTGLKHGGTVVDLGAGSGFFALASAKIVGDEGQVYVVDVLEKALEHVHAAARLKNYQNIKTIHHNLEMGTVSAIPSASADLVIVANLMHQIKSPGHLMDEIYRMLKTSGQLLVLDWNGNPSRIGPGSSSRISEEDAKAFAVKSSLKFETLIDTDEFHYGLVFSK